METGSSPRAMDRTRLNSDDLSAFIRGERPLALRQHTWGFKLKQDRRVLGYRRVIPREIRSLETQQG